MPITSIIRRQRAVLLAASLLLHAFVSSAAESELLRTSELLESENAREILTQPVKLYSSKQATPAFAEIARPDSYTRWSLSRNLFGGSRRHCIDAFEQALQAMVKDAAARGYDAIIGLKAESDNKITNDPETFYCKPGYRTTEVTLTAAFAMTPAAAHRLAEVEAFVAEGPPRPPWDENIYLPLDTLLSSNEAKAILGPDITAHWGLSTPAYSERHGPDTYYDYGDILTLGKEGACRQAALKVLQAMAGYAREQKFDALIRIRSYLYDQYTPFASDFECELGKKRATVQLRASLAKLKP